MTKSKASKEPSKKEIKKQNQKSALQFIGFVLIIALLFGGMIGYSKYKVAKHERETNYNGFEFYFDEYQGFWMTQIEIGKTPYNIPFYYHPKDLKDIYAEDDIEDIILRNWPKRIVVAIPNDSGADMFVSAMEITKITGDRYDLLKIPTTSAVNEPFEGLPYVTCEDANHELVVINFIRSDKSLITSDGRCIKLEFKDQANESTRVADAFAYRLLKII